MDSLENELESMLLEMGDVPQSFTTDHTNTFESEIHTPDITKESVEIMESTDITRGYFSSSGNIGLSTILK